VFVTTAQKLRPINNIHFSAFPIVEFRAFIGCFILTDLIATEKEIH